MMLMQLATKPAQEAREQSSRKAAQKAVLGWFTSLRSRAMSFLKKLFS
jgi:hypothetical protein